MYIRITVVAHLAPPPPPNLFATLLVKSNGFCFVYQQLPIVFFTTLTFVFVKSVLEFFWVEGLLELLLHRYGLCRLHRISTLLVRSFWYIIVLEQLQCFWLFIWKRKGPWCKVKVLPFQKPLYPAKVGTRSHIFHLFQTSLSAITSVYKVLPFLSMSPSWLLYFFLV